MGLGAELVTEGGDESWRMGLRKCQRGWIGKASEWRLMTQSGDKSIEGGESPGGSGMELAGK